MAQHRKKKVIISKEIALERINYLFYMAGDTYALNPSRSARYALLAQKIGMRYRVSLPSDLKRKMCKKCNQFLVPGSNSRVRMGNGSIIITCLNCGSIKRYPFNKTSSKEPV
jgi:ribonuclease P protein subunit RPR2